MNLDETLMTAETPYGKGLQPIFHQIIKKKRGKPLYSRQGKKQRIFPLKKHGARP
jgi:hypothetical protein